MWQGNFLASADLIDQRKNRGGQQPQVLAVLFVDAFDVLSDHQLYARANFG